MRLNKQRITDNFLVFILVAASGMPSFASSYKYLYIALLLSSAFIFIKRKKKLDKLFVIFILFFSFILVAQIYIFSLFPLVTILGLYVRILIAYLIIKIVGVNFVKIYIKLLFYIVIISLLFYVSTNLSITITSFLIENFSISEIAYNLGSYYRHNIMGIYILTPEQLWKNSGPFWESGAFAGYTLLAYVLNHFYINNKKVGLVLLIGVLTSGSTSGIIGLIIFGFIIFVSNRKNFITKIIATIVASVFALYSYINIEFMGSKIEHQLTQASMVENAYTDSNNTQRFLNILRDTRDFEGHEIFGRGANPETRYSFKIENQIRTVGLTDILVKFGFPFFLFMMYFLYKSIGEFLKSKNQHKIHYKNGIFITILVLLMSELYFNYPLFWSLLFIQFAYKSKNNRELN